MSAFFGFGDLLGFAFRSLALGLLLGAVHTLGQFLAAGLAIPLFIGLRRDFALDQQLRELTPLRFALEWHGYYRARSKKMVSSLLTVARRVCVKPSFSRTRTDASLPASVLARITGIFNVVKQ